jgi:predicted AlkP superfamily phosphohydrolase/phosphomutase
MSRVLVIGLDALSPQFVQQWSSELPNLRHLMETGIYGPLQSIVQPITPAAWTALVSGHDPGHFGFTDFLYRVGNSYTDFRLIHSRMVHVPTLYTLLPAAGQQVLLIGLPVTYPPVAIPGGVCVSCFMAPSMSKAIVSPPQWQEELLAQTTSPYVLDVVASEQTREPDRDELLQQIHEMDRQRFDTAAYLMKTCPWNLLFMVAMGTDRVGHYFIRYLDPQHGTYADDPRYRNAIRDHYRYCDTRLGELIDQAGPDTVVLVVSDHGMQRQDGKVNLNDWLIAKGYLRLHGTVDAPTPLGKAPVDWSHTQAWARGYGGQIYLNIRGREPEGCIEPAQADAVLEHIEDDLKQLRTADGHPLPVRALRRRFLYSGPHAESCPDLFLQFDDLHYLTSDLVGHNKLVTPIAELGCDGGSHSSTGFLALSGPGIPAQGYFSALNLLDVAPTILHLLDVPIPSDMEGRPIHVPDDVYSSEDEDELTSRLKTLYLE